jgi:hypothetical protein
MYATKETGMVKTKSQIEKFKKAARDLEADDSEKAVQWEAEQDRQAEASDAIQEAQDQMKPRLPDLDELMDRGMTISEALEAWLLTDLLLKKGGNLLKAPVYLTKLVGRILGCIDHLVLGIDAAARHGEISLHVRLVTVGVYLLLFGGHLESPVERVWL